MLLTKYHGLGNDFLVTLDPPVAVDAALARRLCDRRRGIGADGLVVGRRAPLSFRLLNADGSAAEMSGNGMRCLAHALADAGVVTAGVPFPVETVVGPREVLIERRMDAGVWVSVAMGEVIFGQDLPMACNVGDGRQRVDVGNPHLVVAGPDPTGIDVAGLGPRLERAESSGLNVEFVALGPGPDELTMRVWERGVGETLACGTGSVAAAAAFHRWGRVGPVVTVHQPGGAAVVALAEGRARLSGPSERIAACTVEPAA